MNESTPNLKILVLHGRAGSQHEIEQRRGLTHSLHALFLCDTNPSLWRVFITLVPSAL